MFCSDGRYNDVGDKTINISNQSPASPIGHQHDVGNILILLTQFVSPLSVTNINVAKRINIRRDSIFKKSAGNLYLGGFRGEKSRDANGF